MIQKINDRLNEYLEFDNNQLYMDSMVRIFGGAIRDSIADQPINDVDILCGSKSIRMVEDVLTQNGYRFLDKFSSVDMINLYANIHVISEPRTWIKGDKIVQLIKPRNLIPMNKDVNFEEYTKNFKTLIENVDLSACGVSWSNGILYENCESAVLHCLNRQFNLNPYAKMFSHERAQHRTGKLESRGWTKVDFDKVEKRDLKIDFLLNGTEEFEFTKEWTELFVDIVEQPKMYGTSKGKFQW